MEIKVIDNKIETTGVKESFAMGVSTEGGHITRFLRDTLYSNKVAAVCREIGSNAYDANVEAGKAEVPVIISIDSKSNILSKGISISFQDSGPGMNRERMKVYSQYAASTKRKTNSQIGGFGLGAKTPFAYSNNYIIETVAEENGVNTKFIYMAVLGGNGQSEESTINLISENPSNEPTGTKIIIPIKEADRNEFEEESYYMSHLWEVQPTFNGFNLIKPKKEVIYTGKGFKVYTKNSILRDNHMCSVAGILYPINTHEVRGFRKVDGSYCVVFEFNTGEISLNGGRELLKYTETEGDIIGTKERIEKRYLEFKEELTAEVHSYYNGAENYAQKLLRAMQLNLYNGYEVYDHDLKKGLDVKREFGYFLSQFNRHILNFKPTSYNNKRLYYDIDFSLLNIEIVTKDSSDPTSYHKAELKRIGPSLLTLPIYEVKPGVRKNVKKILSVLKEHEKAILIYHPKKMEALHDHQKDKYKDEIELIQNLELELRDFNEVKPIKINLGNESKNNKIIKINVRKINATCNTYSYNNSKETVQFSYDKENIELIDEDGTFDIAKHVVIIPVKDLTHYANAVFDSLSTKLKFFGDFCNEIGLLRDEIVILFVSETKMKYFEDVENIIELDELFNLFINHPKMQERIQDIMLYNKCEIFDISYNRIRAITKLNLEIKEFASKIIKTLKQINAIPSEKRYLLKSLLRTEEIFKERKEKYDIETSEDNKKFEEVKEILKKYPVIDLIETGDSYSDNEGNKQLIKAVGLLIKQDEKKQNKNKLL